MVDPVAGRRKFEPEDQVQNMSEWLSVVSSDRL
jgi:hypothetical protein